MFTKERIEFLSNGTWGVRPRDDGHWELFFHTDPMEVIAVCPDKYIQMVAMILNGHIQLRR